MNEGQMETPDINRTGINKFIHNVLHKIDMFLFELFGGLKKPCKGELEHRKIVKEIMELKKRSKP